MTYKAGQAVRINDQHLSDLVRRGYYRAGEDDGVGVISKMLNASIAQVELPGSLPHRLLHVANIEPA